MNTFSPRARPQRRPMTSTSRRARHALLAVAVSAPVLATPAAFAAPVANRPEARPERSRPPVVRVEPSWRFQLGAQVDRTAKAPQYRGDLRVFHQSVPVELTWSGRARDGARIVDYELERYDPYRDRMRTVLRDTTATVYETRHTDLAYPPPGTPAKLEPYLHPTFTLTATDSRGRSTTVEDIQRDPLFSEQENGSTYQEGRTVFPEAPRAGRGWYRQTDDRYDAGAVLASQRRGAAIRIPVETHEDQWIALVMTTGPRLGAVEVRVDGERVGVVDTYHHTKRPRVLVAQYRLDAGEHTVTVVNLGLRHRETVELDAVFASD